MTCGAGATEDSTVSVLLLLFLLSPPVPVQVPAQVPVPLHVAPLTPTREHDCPEGESTQCVVVGTLLTVVETGEIGEIGVVDTTGVDSDSTSQVWVMETGIQVVTVA